MIKNNQEESPMGRWISYRPELKILDCTVRDGGLMNNHLFDDETVRAIYTACVDAGIDYMEIGYINSRRLFAPAEHGAWKYCGEDDIRRIVGENDTTLKLSAMADAEKSDYREDILPCDQSVLDMIRVAAYIHQRPASHGQLVPDVLGILEIVCIGGVHGQELTNFSRAHQLPGFLPLGVKTIHERFHEPHTPFGGILDTGGRLLCVQSEGFFTEYMLTRIRRFSDPLRMEMIGKRNVDRFDIRIGQQVRVGPVRSGNPEGFCRHPSLVFAPRGDRHEIDGLRFQQRWQDFFHKNFSSPNHTPTYRFHDLPLHFLISREYRSL